METTGEASPVSAMGMATVDFPYPVAVIAIGQNRLSHRDGERGVISEAAPGIKKRKILGLDGMRLA